MILLHQNKMKIGKILCGLIGLLSTINLYGQITEKVEVDTLKVIKTEKIPTKEIVFGIPYGKVFISKASLIEVWNKKLALMKSEIDENPQNSKSLLKDYKESKSYLEFLKKQKTLFFKHIEVTDFSEEMEEEKPETDTLYYIENRLKGIACDLIDVGKFEIQINNKKIEKVVKAKVSRRTILCEMTTTEYIVNDSIYFWNSLPGIIACSSVDPENMYVPEPPPKKTNSNPHH